MALFNESLVGRFNRLISRLHGMKGPTPAPQIAPEMQHIIPIESTDSLPENNYLGDVVTWWLNGVIGPVAANFTWIACVNLTPGLLVIIDGFISNTATTVRAQMQTTSGAALQAAGFRDGRQMIANADKTQPGILTPQAVADPIIAGNALIRVAGPAFIWNIPVILPPNRMLLVVPSVVNVGADVSFFGRVRALQESET